MESCSDERAKRPLGDETSSDVIPRGPDRRVLAVNVTWAKSHLAVLKRALSLNGLRSVENPCAGSKAVLGDIVWVVTADDVEQRAAALKPRQWLSHVPGLPAVCTKQGLAQALALAEEDFPWAPKTWLLPRDQCAMLAFCKRHPHRALIYKPSNAGMAESVFLMMGEADAERKISIMRCDAAIAQVYIERPLLIDGRKCDLRLFVVLFCPEAGSGWRAALFHEGLVRICAEPYAPASRSTLHHTATHLTNTAISSLQTDSNAGSCTETLAELANRVGQDAWAGTWQSIRALLGRVMALCQLQVLATTCRCFQIVGADVLLDDELTPHLLELNDLVSLKLGRTVLKDDPVVRDLGLKLCTAPCFDHRAHAHAPCHTDEQVKIPLVASVLTAVQRFHSLGIEISDEHLLDGLAFDSL